LVPVDPVLNWNRPNRGSHVTNDLAVVVGQLSQMASSFIKREACHQRSMT
jgi:hypothetical protein